MEINAVFIVTIVIFLLFILLGFSRGVLGIVYGVASWVFLFFFVNWASPQIYTNLQGGQIEEKVSTQVYEFLDERTADATTNMTDSLGDMVKVDDVKDVIYDTFGVKLPDKLIETDKKDSINIKKLLKDINLGEIVDKASKDTRGTMLVEVTAIITAAVMRGIATVIAIAIALIICMVVLILIKIIGKLPALGEANKILGVLFGACEGILVVWVLMYVISIIPATDIGVTLMSQIDNNFILKYLYDNNQVMAFFAGEGTFALLTAGK